MAPKKKVKVLLPVCPRCGDVTDLEPFICKTCFDRIVKAKPLFPAKGRTK